MELTSEVLIFICLSSLGIAVAFCLAAAVWFRRIVSVLEVIYFTPLENLPGIIRQALQRRFERRMKQSSDVRKMPDG